MSKCVNMVHHLVLSVKINSLLEFYLNIFSQTHFLHWWYNPKSTDAVKVWYLYSMCIKWLLVFNCSEYWFHRQTDWTDSRWSEWVSTRRVVAEVIRGWGPWCPHLGCRAGGGRLSGPGTLCRSLVPPAPCTTQGNPRAVVPWTVIKVKGKILAFCSFFSILCLQMPSVLSFILVMWTVNS